MIALVLFNNCSSGFTTVSEGVVGQSSIAPDSSSSTQPPEISTTTPPIETTVANSTPTPAPTATPGTGGTSNYTGPIVEYFGHFDTTDPKGPKFSWSSSSMKLTFKGKSVSASLAVGGSDQYYFVRVDSSAPTRILLTGGTTVTKVLASNLDATLVHEVLLFKDTEAGSGSQFLGFSVDGGDLLVTGTTKTYPLRLEFVGDYISCGQYTYADAQTGACPSTETIANHFPYQSAFVAFPQQTADMLQAPPAVSLCWDQFGMGVGKGNNPGKTIANFYDTLGVYSWEQMKYDYTKDPAPDVVVIELGTQDIFSAPGGDGPSDLAEKYEAFIATVRGHYPNAHIIATTGPVVTGGALATAVKAVVEYENTTKKDSKVHLLAMTPVNAPNTTCMSRPNQAAQKLFATQVAAFIKQLGF